MQKQGCYTVNGAVTITIIAKSSLSITHTISTQAQSFFHRRQTKIKRTTITTVLKAEAMCLFVCVDR